MSDTMHNGSDTGPGGGGWLRDERVFVFTREQIQALDRAAVEEFHLPTAVLMENAARSAADEILAWLELEMDWGSSTAPPRIVVLCGRGNNGGDGLALARHLHNAGVRSVSIVLLFDADDDAGDRGKLSDATAMNLQVCEAMGLPIVSIAGLEGEAALVAKLDEVAGDADVLVDGLLGTGVTGAPRPPADAVIEWMNGRGDGVKRVSLDVPSGLDCDTGKAAGACVRADLTVTFVGLKSGFLELDAHEFIGEIAIGEIGAPVELSERLGTELDAEGV